MTNPLMLLAQMQPPTQATPPAGGAPPGGGGQPPPGGGGSSFIWIMMLLFVGMFVMMALSGRRQQKRRKEMLASIQKRDRVQTLGGVIGTVVELNDQEVVLRVDEASNTRICFARAAVQQVLSSADGQTQATPAQPQLETART